MPRPAPPADPTAKHNLTAASVDRLPIRSAKYTVTDARQPGFEVRVNTNGMKTFYVRYRTPDHAHQRRMRIGHFPEMTPDDARKIAAMTRGEASKGRDPVGEVKARRSVSASILTVEKLSDRYLSAKEIVLKPSTRAQYTWIMNNAIAPVIGSLRVDVVDKADVTRLQREHAEKPTKANQALRYLSRLLRYAESEGMRPANSSPVSGVKRFKEELHEVYLNDEQLKALFGALTLAASKGLPAGPTDAGIRAERNQKRRKRGDVSLRNRPGDTGQITPSPQGADVIELLLATGMRREEALSLEWSSVNLDDRRLDLKDTKTGRSFRPLNASAVEIITRQKARRVLGNPYVFPAPTRVGAHLLDVSKLWNAVRHHAKLDHVRLHDLRHTAASLAIQGGAHLAEVGRMLGHASPRTTARYAHMSDDGSKFAADRIDVALKNARAEQEAEPKAAHAVARPLRRRRGIRLQRVS